MKNTAMKKHAAYMCSYRVQVRPIWSDSFANLYALKKEIYAEIIFANRRFKSCQLLIFANRGEKKTIFVKFIWPI